MIFSRLACKNWRNFLEVDVTLQDRVFVIGPNASGKSNLLDAFRFLRDIAKAGGGLQSAITRRGSLSKIRCLAARRDPDIELAVELADGAEDNFRYEIGITQQVRGYRLPILRYERVFKNGKQVLNRPDENDKKDELRLSQTHLEQINSNAQFREIGKFFETIRYLHLVPQLVRNPESYQGPGVPDDPYGRNFLEIVAKTPEKARRSRLRRIDTALRHAVPQLKNLTDAKDEAGVPHLEVIHNHWRPNAGKQREDQFSDGTLRLIGLFWSLLDGDSPLLLEEPELSLHPAIVKELPSLFARLQRKRPRQLFVSTHSWEMLSDRGIGGEEVLLLDPSQEGTKVAQASSVKEVRDLLVAGVSIADAALTRSPLDGSTLQLSLGFQ